MVRSIIRLKKCSLSLYDVVTEFAASHMEDRYSPDYILPRIIICKERKGFRYAYLERVFLCTFENESCVIDHLHIVNLRQVKGRF